MKQFPTLLEFLANSVSLKIESYHFQIKYHNRLWGGSRAPPPLGLGLSTVWVLGSLGARPLQHQVRPPKAPAAGCPAGGKRGRVGSASSSWTFMLHLPAGDAFYLICHNHAPQNKTTN